MKFPDMPEMPKMPEMPRMPDMPKMHEMPRFPELPDQDMREVRALGRITSDIQYSSSDVTIRVVRYSSGLIRAWHNGREIPVDQHSLQKATQQAKDYKLSMRDRAPHAGKFEYGRFSHDSHFSQRSDQPVYHKFSELKKIWRAMKNSKRVSKGDKKDE